MRLRVFHPVALAGLCVLALAGCSCDSPAVTQSDTTFRVVKTLPADGATDVPVSGSIDIEFNHALRDEQNVLSDAYVYFEPVDPPHVISKVAPKRIQVQLLQPLPYGAVITAVVQGLQDKDNKPLHAYEFTFVTEIDLDPPSVPTPAFSYEITRDNYYDITGGRDPYTYIWVGYSSSLTDSQIELSRYAEGSGDDPFGLAERFTVRVELDEGINRVGLMSEDLAGNTSEPVFVTVERDSVAPAAPELDQAPVSPTSESLLVLHGTVDSDALVQAYLNGELRAVEQGEGTWSLTLTLSEGTNTLNLLAVDRAQNTSAAVALSVKLDTTRPVITLGTLPARTSDSCVTVSGTVSESSTIYLNGVQTGGATSFNTCHLLAAGQINTLELVAVDELGHTTQLRRYVTQGDGPALVQTLPEHGASVAGNTHFAVRYFFDQPLATAPSAGAFVLSAGSDTSSLSNHRYTLSVVPDSAPAAGNQSVTATYAALNSAGQSGDSLSSSAFTWATGAASPAIAAVTATALDNRGIQWSLDFDAPEAQWFVVAVTQTSLTGSTLTSVIQGDTSQLPLILTAPLPWAPLALTATAYSASGEATSVHRTLYPASAYTDLGLPFADAAHELVVLAAPAVSAATAWDLYVGAATAHAVARIAQSGTGPSGFTGAHNAAVAYSDGPARFGSAITYSSSHVYVASPNGTDCLYQLPAPLNTATVTVSDSFVCSDDTPGVRLYYDSATDLLWSNATSYLVGSDVGRVVAYDPADASVQYDWRGVNDFLPLAGFHGAAGTRQWLLHAGEGSLQSYHLRSTSQIYDSAAPTPDALAHAYAAGDFDGDGHDDAVLFTRNNLSDTSIAIYMYAGGHGGDLIAERSMVLSGWDDFCVHALRGVGDLDGDGADDLVCSSADSVYEGTAMIVWGGPAFFADATLRVSAVNVADSADLISVRALALMPIRDLSADTRAELALQLSTPLPRLVVYH